MAVTETANGRRSTRSSRGPPSRSIPFDDNDSRRPPPTPTLRPRPLLRPHYERRRRHRPRPRRRPLPQGLPRRRYRSSPLLPRDRSLRPLAVSPRRRLRARVRPPLSPRPPRRSGRESASRRDAIDDRRSHHRATPPDLAGPARARDGDRRHHGRPASPTRGGDVVAARPSNTRSTRVGASLTQALSRHANKQGQRCRRRRTTSRASARARSTRSLDGRATPATDGAGAR